MQGGSSGPPVASFPGLPDAISSPPAQRTEGVGASSSGSLKAESNSIDSIRSTSLLTQAGLPLASFIQVWLSESVPPALSLPHQSSLLRVMILIPCPQCLHCSALIHFVSLDLNVTSSGSLPLFAKVIGLLVTSALCGTVWLPIRNASQLCSSRSLGHTWASPPLNWKFLRG